MSAHEQVILGQALPHALGQAASNNDGLAWLGIAVWIALILAALCRSILLNLAYLRRCRQMGLLDATPSNRELPIGYLVDPVYGWLPESVTAPQRLRRRLLFTPQANPSLEAQRRQVVRWIWITIAITTFGIVIPAGFWAVGIR